MKRALAVLLLLTLVCSVPSVSFAATVKKAKSKKTVPVVAAPKPKMVKPVPASPARSAMLVEAGFGGGAGVFELVYQRKINDRLSYSGGLGYGVGNKYGVLILDVARLSMEMGAFTVGLGATYASYSNLVADIPGLSGTIPNKSMFGFELLAGKSFGKISARLAYNTALGLRAALSYNL